MKKLILISVCLISFFWGAWLYFQQKNPQGAKTISTIPDTVSKGENNAKPSQNSVVGLDSLNTIGQLRDHLKKLTSSQSVETIQRLLDSGTNFTTHLGFVLSPDGSLKEAPSLRTFLLDYLIQIDTKAAAAYAEKIFRSSNSPDEWAIAFRAYALGNSTEEGQGFLREKIHQMVQNKEWRKNPSTGFLEAFDVFVYTHDTSFVSKLAAFINDTENHVVGHAAYLALDRLVQSDPVPTLKSLLEQPKLLENHSETRANFFARADLRDPDQKKILVEYLLSTDRSPLELEAFAGIFPNANFFISNNLLTKSHGLDGTELRNRDTAALLTVNEWVTNDQFKSIRPQLEKIRGRLETFVK